MPGFAGERRSGSGDVALGFLEALARHVEADPATRPDAFRASLLAWLRAAQARQPSMALVHQLAARALEVADTGVRRGDRLPDVRASLEASCAAERDDLLEGRAALARQAVALVERRGTWIATLSASTAILAALEEAKRRGLEPRVLLAEGRPNLEGREMAARLAAAGIPVWLVVDAALPLLLSQAGQLWLGADAVTDQGVINKIGSFAAALAAREHSVPVWVVAGRRKFLPASTASLRIAEQPGGEVWDAPAAGVEARNVYFELVPLPLVRGIVVEDAVLGPGEAATLARERPLPEELAAG